MSFTNSRHNYGWSVVFLHWLLFILIAGLLGSGLYSASLERDEKIGFLIANHKQIGVAVGLLMMFRLLWRLINTSVVSLADNALLRLLATLNHWLLYLVVIGQAFIGTCMVQAAGREVSLYGLKIPQLGGENGLLTGMAILTDPRQLRLWHEYGAYAIIALIALHFLAALVHHFYWGDDTLRRMWFGFVPPYEKETRSNQL